MPGYEFTDPEREFMTVIDSLVEAGHPIEGRATRLGEERVGFIPGESLRICSNVVIGFASRPIGRADMGFYDEAGISAYHVSATEQIPVLNVNAAHLFHLRDGVIWHRQKFHHTDRDYAMMDEGDPILSTYGVPLPPEDKEELIDWLSRTIPDLPAAK